MRLHTSSIPFYEFIQLYPPLKRHYAKIGCKSLVFMTLREPLSHRLSSIKYCKQVKCLRKYTIRKHNVPNGYDYLKLNNFAPHSLQYLFLTDGCVDVLCSNIALGISTYSRSIEVHTLLKNLHEGLDLMCVTDKFAECLSIATKLIDLNYCGYSISNVLREKAKRRYSEQLEQAVSIHDNSADMSLYAEQSKTFTALYKSVCKSSCPVCERHKSRAELYQRARERGIMKE